MTAVSPLVFGACQLCARLAPWVLLGPGLIVVAVGAGHLLHIDWWQIAIEGAVGALGALGYAAWAASLDWHGLVRRPRRPWRVACDQRSLSVHAERLETAVPLERIQSAHVVVDGGWDALKGVEEECLVLRVRGAPRISLPGSSTGYEQVRERLAEVMPVGTVEVGVE